MACFDNGHLIIYESGGRVTVRLPKGAPPVSVSAEGPISNAAVDNDGFIAGAVNEGSVWGIALFRADGRRERFIETTPDMPVAIRIGPDHTLWAVVYRPNPTLAGQPDFAILRNYGREGRLIGAYLPRKMFDAEASGVGPNLGFALLHVAGRRIGIMAGIAQEGRKQQWLEADLQGNVTGRWDVPGYLVGGLTAGGAVYGTDGSGTGVYRFDRAAQRWSPVAAAGRGWLVGVDGEQLVLLDGASGLAQWAGVGQSRGGAAKAVVAAKRLSPMVVSQASTV